MIHLDEFCGIICSHSRFFTHKVLHVGIFIRHMCQTYVFRSLFPNIAGSKQLGFVSSVSVLALNKGGSGLTLHFSRRCGHQKNKTLLWTVSDNTALSAW
jgi:hypothetical protein